VYYGSICAPPSDDEVRVLTQWDMLIVDPLQLGILEGLSGLTNRPRFVVGRIDIADLTAGTGDADRVKRVELVIAAIIKYMGPTAESPVYNGVLIANWDQKITPGIYNELTAFLNDLNLNVYNEITAPRFMDSINSNINVDNLAGMVFVNASIMPNGDRRDYFDLLPMKRALEIVTARSCIREFAVLMCEIVNDDARLTNAVVKRCFSWCSYYGAVNWIGPKAALKDPRVNCGVSCPASGFEWLKLDKVMDIHEIWRLNSKVRRLKIL
jgi:hypothetical protein